jgi:hypothetical protein
MYKRQHPSGFGKAVTPAAPRSKPLKRPTQARGKFTVQAIYDAFVRIWQAEGWEGVTTRAVALETGIAIGTPTTTSPTRRRCSRAMCATASRR